MGLFRKRNKNKKTSVETPENAQKKKEEEKDFIKGVDDAKPATVKELLLYATNQDKFLLVVGSISACITGLALPVMFIFFGSALSDFQTPSEALESGKTNALSFLYLGIGLCVSAFLQVSCFTTVAERMVLKIRHKYLESLLKQDIAFFDASSGSLSSKIAENTVLVRDGTAEKLGQLFQFGMMFLGGFVIGFIYCWQLTLLVLAVTPILAICGFAMMQQMKNSVNGTMDAYEVAGEVAEGVFDKIQTVISFNLQRRLREKYELALQIAQKAGIKKAIASAFGIGTITAVYFSTFGLAFWYGAKLIVWSEEDAAKLYPPTPNTTDLLCRAGAYISAENAFALGCSAVGPFTFDQAVDVCRCLACNCGCYFGGVSVSCVDTQSVVTSFFVVVQGGFSLGQVAPSITAYFNALVAMGKINAIINRQPEIDESSTDGKKLDTIHGNIEFKNVKFRYPTRPEAIIFKHLNLNIEPNTSIALVGGTGCGKSTVTQLLQRFYDPEEGSITLDGVSIKDLNIGFLRSQIGVVGQEPVLFAASVFENISYGLSKNDRESMSKEELQNAVENAARMANAYDFIMNFPEQFDSFVGEKGATMSGGQKQRIAIARALIRNPRILILDEATSALDNQSEKIVQEALEKLIQGQERTTIMIAHRLTSIEKCDTIFVLGEGGVLEKGSHETLANIPNGHYQALLTAAQQSESKAEGDDDDCSEDDNMNLEPTSVDNTKNESGLIDSAIDLVEGIVDSQTEIKVEKSKNCFGCFNGSNNEKKKKKEELYKVPISRVFKFSKKTKKLFIPATIGSAANGSVMPLFALLFAGVLTVYTQPNSNEILSKAGSFGLYFLYFGIASFFTNVIAYYCFGLIAEEITTNVRTAVFDSLLKQEAGYFDLEENSIGAVTSRLAAEAAQVKASCADRLNLVVQNLVTILVGLLIAFLNGWKLTLVLIATLPLMVLGGFISARSMAGVASADSKSLENAGQLLTESINGVRTVRAFQMNERICELYDSFLAPAKKTTTKKGVLAGFGFGISQGSIFFVYALAFYYGGILISNEEYSYSEFVHVFMAITFMGFGIGQTASLAPDVAKSKNAISIIFKMIDRESKIDPFASGKTIEESNIGEEDFQFKNVQFKYPSRPNVKVFTKLNLDIKKNTTVALVGMSGSGKSSVIKMIERFYDVNRGELLHHGENIKDLDQVWYRNEMALVSQEPDLFNASILENISFGLPEKDFIEDKGRVIEAAKSAGAHDFIEALPDGYDTSIKASSLSGGQKQRIAIARALIRQPKVLLLDEATSALDNETEKLVQVSLDKYSKEHGLTCVVVAHRLSSIQHADVIHVVHQGVIVESGTHSKLISDVNGAYYKLYKSQN